MDKTISIQDLGKRSKKENYIIDFDVQTDLAPTKPLIHKNSRFLYILEGRGKIEIQNKIYDLYPGVVVSILPWQISEIVEVTEKLSYYLVVYNFNLLAFHLKNNLNIENDSSAFIDFLYEHTNTVYKEAYVDKFKSLFDDVKHEIGISSLKIPKQRDEYSTMLLIAKLSELLIYFIRNLSEDEKSIEADETYNKKSILSYMFLNSNKDISLKMLSKIFLMSESSISKYINTITGLKFYRLLNEMRLFRAEYLLLHTSLSLDRIADIVNFTDSSYLSKLILEEYGYGTKTLKKDFNKVESVTQYRLNKDAVDIINYINDNYDKNINIDTLADEFRLSSKTVNRILKYYTEKTFNTLLNFVRVNKSYTLLLNTEYTIEDISLAVGYNSKKTYYRNFVRMNNITPSEFREKYKDKVDKHMIKGDMYVNNRN